jgi:hypothetical protein
MAIYRDWVLSTAAGAVFSLATQIVIDLASPVGQQPLWWQAVAWGNALLGATVLALSQGWALRRTYPVLSLYHFVIMSLLPTVLIGGASAAVLIEFGIFNPDTTPAASADTSFLDVMSRPWVIALMVTLWMVLSAILAAVGCLLQWLAMRKAMAPLLPWLVSNLVAAVVSVLPGLVAIWLVWPQAAAQNVADHRTVLIVNCSLAGMTLLYAAIVGLGLKRLHAKIA